MTFCADNLARMEDKSMTICRPIGGGYGVCTSCALYKHMNQTEQQAAMEEISYWNDNHVAY